MLDKSEINRLEHQAIVAALFRLCDPRRMENLKIGDTVRLKSGGPVMTLGPELASGGWVCNWFEGHTAKRENYYLEQLEKAEPDKEWKGEGLE